MARRGAERAADAPADAAGDGPTAERRDSADALSVPLDAPVYSTRRSTAAGAGAGAAGSETLSPPEETTPGSAPARSDAPPSGRSAPRSDGTAAAGAGAGNPLSPDLSNLSPMHPPSRQYISVPPMVPLPDPAGGFAAPFDDIALSPTGREAAEVLSTLTGTKRSPADAELTDHGMDDGGDGGEEDEYDDDGRAKKLRGSRCGTCINCLQPDCGKCTNCLDKPKFGGPGVKKQACTGRKCLNPNVRTGAPRPPVSLFRPPAHAAAGSL